MPNNYLYQIREYISKDNITEAIRLMTLIVVKLNHSDSIWSEFDTQLILANNRLERIEKESHLGTISFKEKSIEKNNIVNQVISIYQKLKEEEAKINALFLNKKEKAEDESEKDKRESHLELKFRNAQKNSDPIIKEVSMILLLNKLKNISFDSGIYATKKENALLMQNIFWDKVLTIQTIRNFNGLPPIKLDIASHARENYKNGVEVEGLVLKTNEYRDKFLMHGGQISYVLKINGPVDKKIPNKIKELAKHQNINMRILRIDNDVFRETDYIILSEYGIVLEWTPGYLNKPIQNMRLRQIRNRDNLIEDWNIIYAISLSI